jgi:hypothetical protein
MPCNRSENGKILVVQGETNEEVKEADNFYLYSTVYAVANELMLAIHFSKVRLHFRNQCCGSGTA